MCSAGAHDRPPHQLVGNLVADVRQFAGGAPPSDDLTALALLYRGANEAMSRTLDLTLGNKVSELDRLNSALTEFGRRHGLAARVLHDLTLALEEVLTNIIAHGYTDQDDHEIAVHLRVDPDGITAEVEDDGRPFDPLETPPPDTTKPLAERPVGGLGIHLVRTFMDRVEYRRQGARNLLIIRRLRERP